MASGSGSLPAGSGVVDMVLLPRGLSVGAVLGACHVPGCCADIMQRGMKDGVGIGVRHQPAGSPGESGSRGRLPAVDLPSWWLL